MSDFYTVLLNGNLARVDGIPIEPKTYRQMCEFIADQKLLAGDPTADEIFNYSPGGELYKIHVWYLDALEMSVKNKK